MAISANNRIFLNRAVSIPKEDIFLMSPETLTIEERTFSKRATDLFNAGNICALDDRNWKGRAKCFFWIMVKIPDFSTFIFVCTPQFSTKLRLNDFRQQHSVWHPLNPFQVGIRLIDNLGVHPPSIEDFYHQFVGSFLASPFETVFRRNDLRGVQTEINEEIL